jgi:hypothetical protein
MKTNNDFKQSFLCCLEDISASASSCHLNFQNVKGIKKETGVISKFLEISPEQTILFACFVELSLQRTVTLESLARYFKCSVLKLINNMHEIETLEKKNYIQKIIRNKGGRYSYNDFGFVVPHHVIEALRKGDPSILTASSKLDLPSFLKQIWELTEMRGQFCITTEQLFAEIEFFISNNKELPFISFIDNSLHKTVSKCTVFAACYNRLKGQFDIGIEGFADSIFDNMGEQLEFSNEVSSGTHELIKNNIMKLITTEFEGDKTITLEAQTAKLLYQDYPSLLVADLKVPGLISHKSIAQKKLFFNDMLARQIKEIEEILKPSKLSAYCQSLKKNNLTMGVVSIFSGSSGTGKTEAVYQIARKTGRDIFMVDLSQTKSKWFGESEKLVKGIFNSYSVLLKNRVIEPILFINEADGLFSKRREIIGQSSSVDQSLNTIQNILLQALESFEGILIATTNLSCNIDKAFERRFTFKIDFQKPDKLVRKRIWKSKLPELSEKNADLLAERYEITGGDIDVQVRQALLQKVLKRESNIFEVLNEICSKGHSFDARTKLGFR